MGKIHNFSAGPSILPDTVFQEASSALVDFNGLGLSLLEVSHRSSGFVDVMDSAVSLVKELLEVPKGYSVVFLQGGASMQFAMVAMNLLREEGSCGYINSGTWASKAIKEAKMIGDAKIIASSEDANFNYIPKGYTVPTDLDYLHFTSNNTIFGTQFSSFPTCQVPLVADMSSDIFSRKINVEDFGLIYAGAQKNMGPAGTTIAIVKDELLGRSGRNIPTMLDYQTHIDKGSMYNTPPVFSVYVSMLTLKWLKNKGGIGVIEKENIDKANLLYGEVDRNPLFVGTAVKEDRSLMNATFVLNDESLKDEFDKAIVEADINGLKGHRSVGGYRASMYNAMPMESVEVLVDVMSNFASKYGN